MSVYREELTVPAGQWRGDPPDGELVIYPTGVMVGIEPGWVTMTGWRWVSGEPARLPATVQVMAEAVPVDLLPSTP